MQISDITRLHAWHDPCQWQYSLMYLTRPIHTCLYVLQCSYVCHDSCLFISVTRLTYIFDMMCSYVRHSIHPYVCDASTRVKRLICRSLTVHSRGWQRQCVAVRSSLLCCAAACSAAAQSVAVWWNLPPHVMVYLWMELSTKNTYFIKGKSAWVKLQDTGMTETNQMCCLYILISVYIYKHINTYIYIYIHLRKFIYICWFETHWCKYYLVYTHP